ncbi:CFAP77 [Scenedesmus sp. PABB004]|nr:CFAP77 [Scenedesmus sp. PABB004]
MKTNVLIAKTELGKVKRTTFNGSPPDSVYGAAAATDAEGARAVISSWREHSPNRHAKPGPDIKAMNRAAADSGLVSSTQVRGFRDAHPAVLRAGAEGVARPAPALPSDRDPGHVYGRPPGFRSAEDCRNCGPAEPPVRALVQGSYAREWVDRNVARQDELNERRAAIPPAPTAASEGHARGAAAVLARAPAGSPEPPGWKMPRFVAHAAPKVTAFMGAGSPQRGRG